MRCCHWNMRWLHAGACRRSVLFRPRQGPASIELCRIGRFQDGTGYRDRKDELLEGVAAGPAQYLCGEGFPVISRSRTIFRRIITPTKTRDLGLGEVVELELGQHMLGSRRDLDQSQGQWLSPTYETRRPFISSHLASAVSEQTMAVRSLSSVAATQIGGTGCGPMHNRRNR